MMLKTVYGPPPADMERIEAVEVEAENCIKEQDVVRAGPAAKTPHGSKGVQQT